MCLAMTLMPLDGNVLPQRGHPEAGLIASRVLWVSHFVDFLNHNRTRANFFTTTFLCQDYLERDVAFNFSQISFENVDTAIQTQPECVTCHDSLDPLASIFGAFQDGVNLDIDQVWLLTSRFVGMLVGRA